MNESTFAFSRRRGEKHRQCVIDTARALFVKHGFHQTAVAQIADAAGMSVGQIYRYFESKEDIIAAVASADIADWLEDGVTSAVAEAAKFGIREVIRRVVSREPSIERCRILTEIIAEAGRSERVAEIYRTIDTRTREGLAEALETIAPGPDYADARAHLADLLFILRLGLTVRRSIGPAS